MININIGVYIAIALTFICAGIFASLFFAIGRNGARKCSSFVSYREAQRLYDTSPSSFARLDRDHDGIACEVLLQRGI